MQAHAQVAAEWLTDCRTDRWASPGRGPTSWALSQPGDVCGTNCYNQEVIVPYRKPLRPREAGQSGLSTPWLCHSISPCHHIPLTACTTGCRDPLHVYELAATFFPFPYPMASPSFLSLPPYHCLSNTKLFFLTYPHSLPRSPTTHYLHTSPSIPPLQQRSYDGLGAAGVEAAEKGPCPWKCPAERQAQRHARCSERASLIKQQKKR